MRSSIASFVIYMALTVGLQTGTITLNWTQGTDDQTPQPELVYELRQSLLPDIDTLENAERNGTIVKPYTAAMDSWTLMNMIPGRYYYNVIIKDKAGNKSVYAMTFKEVQNPAPSSNPPVVTTNLVEGQSVTKKINIQGKATDDVGVVSIEIYAAGIWLGRSNPGQTSLTVGWNSNPYKGREVLIQITAMDAENQKTTLSRKVRVR